MDSIGYRISKARRIQNINQKELAKKANITEGSLSRYENDIREPKLDSLRRLAIALEVSGDYILGLTNDTESKNIKPSHTIDNDLYEIFRNLEQKLLEEEVLFLGESASKETIDIMLKAMRMGMLLAIDEKNKNR